MAAHEVPALCQVSVSRYCYPTLVQGHAAITCPCATEKADKLLWLPPCIV